MADACTSKTVESTEEFAQLSNKDVCSLKGMDEQALDTVGKRLKFARSREGYRWSLERVARDASKRIPGGIRWQTLQALESEASKGSKHIIAIAQALGVSAEWLAQGRGPMLHPTNESEPMFVRDQDGIDSPNPNIGINGMIPVLGLGECGPEGWSLWNGDTIDVIQRPPFLNGVANAYAVFVTGTSMEPRYHPSETVFVHPGKPVAIGSYVLVQTVPKIEGDPPRAFIKRLAKRTPEKIVLEQFNPPKTFEIKAGDIISMHRIMGSGE